MKNMNVGKLVHNDDIHAKRKHFNQLVELSRVFQMSVHFVKKIVCCQSQPKKIFPGDFP